MVFAVLLEVVLLMPFVDHLADSNKTIHFTQQGFIFAGGVLLGLALRDVQRAPRHRQLDRGPWMSAQQRAD